MSEARHEAERYFTALFTGKPDGLPVVVWTKESKRTHYALTVEGAVRVADQAAAVSDVYAGVGFAPKNASRNIGPHRRPSKAQVAGIVGLWCDVDVNGGPEDKTGAAPDRDTAMALLAASPQPPSMIVDSGYGLQPYWLFDEPWIFDTAASRTAAGDLAAKWIEQLRTTARGLDSTFGIDSTRDIARVLRVPGTFNLKGGHKAPVRLVAFEDDDCPRYSIEALAQHVSHVQLTLGTGATTSPAEEIVVHVRPNAEPPFDKFTALKEVDDLFASAWDRDRADVKSKQWSASEWDLALCDRAVRARWDDQELTDLMVKARVKNGDGLKRPDYYARTIARCRATIDLSEREARREEAITELEAPPVTALDSDPEHVLGLFEEVVGVPLQRFVQYGRDPDEGGVFELALAGGYTGQVVRIGDAEELLNMQKVRARIATVTGVLMPAVERPRWDKVVERLLRVRELHESETETNRGVLAVWLRAYVAATEGGDRIEALMHSYPHVYEGKLYLSRDHFSAFIRARFGERVRRRDLSSWLRSAGFATEKVSYRKPKGTTSSVSLYTRDIEGEDA